MLSKMYLRRHFCIHLLMALTAFFGSTVAITASAAPKPPYSMTWQESVVSKKLSAHDADLMRFIVQDSLWYDDSRNPDSYPTPRELRGNRYGLEELESILELAENGDEDSLRILKTLLETSAFSRPLEGLERSSIWAGTLIIRPDDRNGNLEGSIRNSVARLLKKSGDSYSRLFKALTDFAAAEPNNTALSETVTALAAVPQFSKSLFLRNYFLLMSVHPEPRVRLSGLFGLAGFASDSFVRETLIEESRILPAARFTEKNWARTQKVFNQIGLQYPKWKSILTEIYERWQREFFQNQIQDNGDHHWERMANAAAAQALLQMVPTIGRGVTVRTDKGTLRAQEALEIQNSISQLKGLASGNGSGFSITRTFVNKDLSRLTHIYPNTLMLDPVPENDWVLKALSPDSRNQVFGGMRTRPVSFSFGHFESVLGLIKYKILQLDPSLDYYRDLDSFQRRILSDVAAYRAKTKAQVAQGGVALNVSSPAGACDAINDICEAAPTPTNVMQFPHREPTTPDDPSREENKSIFVAPLEMVYGARALILFGEKDLAAEVLISLLPKTWDLSEHDKKALAKNISIESSDNFRSADLSDESKTVLLKYLFQGLAEALGESNTRRVLIRWLAEVRDAELLSHARTVIAQLCEDMLAP